MTALIFLSLFGIAALFMLVLAVAFVRHYPPAGIGLACLVLILLWEVPYPPPIVELSGLNIYPADAATLVLMTVGVLELPQLRANLRGFIFPWFFFGATIAVSLISGIVEFGIGTAVNEARGLVYFFFAMTWALAVRPDRLRLRDVSMVLGWSLVLVALYHGVKHGIGSPSSWVSVGDGELQTGRLLVASQGAALLLCGAVVFLGLPGSVKVHRQFSALSSIVFLGVAVLAQHRSVWAAGALGMVAVLILTGTGQARHRVFILTGASIWLVLLGWSAGFLDGMGAELLELTDTRTYNWRTASWQVLISEAIANGPATILVGQPFGSGYLRQLDTGKWTSVTAHSWYVTVFLRLGIVGLVAYLAILIPALMKSRAKGSVWTFIIVAVSVYSWSYMVDWYLAPWLGAAVTVSLGSGGITQEPISKSALGKVSPITSLTSPRSAPEIARP